MAKPVQIEVWNPNGKYRVVSTKPMPGTRWINLLIQQDCRLEVLILFRNHSLLFIILVIFRNIYLFIFVDFVFRYAQRRKLYCLLKI